MAQVIESPTDRQTDVLRSVVKQLEAWAEGANDRRRSSLQEFDVRGAHRRPRPERQQVLMLDGGRGTGKTSLLLTIVEAWYPKGVAAWCPEDERRALEGCWLLPTVDFDPVPDGLPLYAWLLSAFTELVRESKEAFEGGQDLAARFDDLQRRAVWGWNGAEQSGGGMHVEDWMLVSQEQLDYWSTFQSKFQCFIDELMQSPLLEHRSLLVVPVDDMDMRATGVRDLVLALSELSHPNVAFIVAADSEQVVNVLSIELARRYNGSGSLVAEKDVLSWWPDVGGKDLPGHPVRLARESLAKALPKRFRQRLPVEPLSALLQQVVAVDGDEDSLSQIIFELTGWDASEAELKFEWVERSGLTMRELVDLIGELRRLNTEPYETEPGHYGRLSLAVASILQSGSRASSTWTASEVDAFEGPVLPRLTVKPVSTDVISPRVVVVTRGQLLLDDEHRTRLDELGLLARELAAYSDMTGRNNTQLNVTLSPLVRGTWGERSFPWIEGAENWPERWLESTQYTTHRYFSSAERLMYTSVASLLAPGENHAEQALSEYIRDAVDESLRVLCGLLPYESGLPEVVREVVVSFMPAFARNHWWTERLAPMRRKRWAQMPGTDGQDWDELQKEIDTIDPILKTWSEFKALPWSRFLDVYWDRTVGSERTRRNVGEVWSAEEFGPAGAPTELPWSANALQALFERPLDLRTWPSMPADVAHAESARVRLASVWQWLVERPRAWKRRYGDVVDFEVVRMTKTVEALGKYVLRDDVLGLTALDAALEPVVEYETVGRLTVAHRAKWRLQNVEPELTPLWDAMLVWVGLLQSYETDVHRIRWSPAGPSDWIAVTKGVGISFPPVQDWETAERLWIATRFVTHHVERLHDVDQRATDWVIVCLLRLVLGIESELYPYTNYRFPVRYPLSNADLGEVGKLFGRQSKLASVGEPWLDWFVEVDECLPTLLSPMAYRAWANDRRPGEEQLLHIINNGTSSEIRRLPLLRVDSTRQIMRQRQKEPFRSIGELRSIAYIGDAVVDELYSYAKSRFGETNS